MRTFSYSLVLTTSLLIHGSIASDKSSIPPISNELMTFLQDAIKASNANAVEKSLEEMDPNHREKLCNEILGMDFLIVAEHHKVPGMRASKINSYCERKSREFKKQQAEVGSLAEDRKRIEGRKFEKEQSQVGHLGEKSKLFEQKAHELEAEQQKALQEVENSRKRTVEQREKRKALEEARLKAIQEEEARRQAEKEEAAAKQKAAEEEEAKQRALEEEAARKRKAAEEEAQRIQEAEQRKAAEEEAARLKAEEEEAARRRKAAEEEALRQKALQEEAIRKEKEAREREEQLRKEEEVLKSAPKIQMDTSHLTGVEAEQVNLMKTADLLSTTLRQVEQKAEAHGKKLEFEAENKLLEARLNEARTKLQEAEEEFATLKMLIGFLQSDLLGSNLSSFAKAHALDAQNNVEGYLNDLNIHLKPMSGQQLFKEQVAGAIPYLENVKRKLAEARQVIEELERKLSAYQTHEF